MKQRALVIITIDPDAKPRSSSTDRHSGTAVNPFTGERETASLFEINIYPNDADGPNVKLTPESMKTSLAHELGHVVGSLANTKANADDPRTKPVGNRWTEHPAEAVIASEQEAWDIARMIAPDLDEREAEANFRSYADPKYRERLDGELKLAILAEMVQHHNPEKGGIN
jgi:hypothetical protein